MRIILLGADGRLGTALRRVLPQYAWIAPTREALDVLDRAAVDAYLAAHPADVLVNAIADNRVDDAETDPAPAQRLNADLPGLLAEAAAAHDMPFVHFSTDYEFDGTKRDGYVESDEPHPLSVYGRTKAEGTKRALGKNPRAYVVRLSRLYGEPGTFPGAKRSFVEIILDQASREARFEVNDAEVSAPTWVDDVARHLDQYILQPSSLLPTTHDPRPLSPGLYHMANQGGATWYEWAKAIIELKGLPNEIVPRAPTARPAKRPAFSALRSTKIPPMRPWREALEEYLCCHPEGAQRPRDPLDSSLCSE